MALLADAEAIRQFDRLHQSVELMKVAMELYSDMMSVTDYQMKEEYIRKYQRAKHTHDFHKEEIMKLAEIHPFLLGSEKAKDLGLI